MDRYYLNLVKIFAWTDFKLKYQGSALGYLWSLLNPLLTFTVLYVVFSYFVKFKVEHYPLFLFLGIILWGFFNEATLNAITSLSVKSSIMKKIYFPRTVIVFASNITTFLGLVLNFLVFFIFYFFTGFTFSFHSFLMIFFLFNLFLLTLGISYIVGALTIRFPDVQHIWRILLQSFFWLTPIVYPVNIIPLRFLSFMYLNPFALIIEGLRDLLLSNHFNFSFYVLSLGYSLLVFFIGLFIYKKMAVYFAELV